MAPRKRVTNSSRPSRTDRPARPQQARQPRGHEALHVQQQKSSLRPAVILVVILIVLIVAVIGVVRGCMMGSSRPLLNAGEEVTVVIEEGATANSIGALLEEYGLVSHSFEFTEEVKREDAAANL